MNRTSYVSCFFILYLFLFVCVNSFGVSEDDNYEQQQYVKRSQFPDGFLFGAGTSAYQIEGAFLEDGKGLSNWDVFSHIKGRMENGDNGDVADDHYHRFLEDIELMHSLGLNAYRFSISWTRVLPRGRFSEVNLPGIRFYNKLIDSLLLKGITPFVTINHFDHPQELEERYGGWLNPIMQEEFSYYAQICFERFGDRVKYWTTINEPNIFADNGYIKGVYPPARCSWPFGNCSAGNSDTEPLIVMHNMLLAHAKAAKLYREHFLPKCGGSIGVVVSANMYKPFNDDDLDRDAANRAFIFTTAWALDPLIYGDYPQKMRHYLGSALPRFTSYERKLITDSIDFIGINHYGTLYAKDCIYSSCVCSSSSCNAGGDHPIRGYLMTLAEKDGEFIGEPTAMPRFFVVPRGMEEIVDYVKKRYPNKPMFVTENGYSSLNATTAQAAELQQDVKRVEFHKSYLASLARAIKNGADVRGYFIWSLMDNLEWSRGYEIKFGLYHVDRSTLDRIPKLSAKWYKDFLTGSSLIAKETRNAISFKYKHIPLLSQKKVLEGDMYADLFPTKGEDKVFEGEDVKRSEFPDDFLFGTSTSAYQIEGANIEDGRSFSTWDVFCHTNGGIANGGNGDIADDHYHRYLEDIDIMASLGVNGYRFSISWSRVLPRGRFGAVNPAGIMFYNNIIDNLLCKGITPFVTIHHTEFPQELEDRFGAWLSPLMQEEFVHFAETCFRSFGNRVKYWATINEPNLFAELAYMSGLFPPTHCSLPFGKCSSGNSDTEPLIVVHNSILAHAKAVKLYRDQFQAEQGGMIGIVASAYMYKPLTDDEVDILAATRALTFHVAWLIDPLVYGDYPVEMREYHGRNLPKFSSEERILIKNSTDFIGLNHYTTLYAKDCLHSNCTCIHDDKNPTCTYGENRAIRGFLLTAAQKDGAFIGDPMAMAGFYVVPQGMEQIVDYIKKRYDNKPIFVTENGYASNDKEEGHDMKRIKYHKAYLASLARSIRNGADVRGYFIWSLMDNFEWKYGYTIRFGLYHVDPLTLNRTPKLSAKWYRYFLTNSRLNYIQAKKAI